MASPQDEAARWFMDRKGYPKIQPSSIDKLEGQPCWYYLYSLPGEGTLELEVSWDARVGEWSTLVTTFQGRSA